MSKRKSTQPQSLLDQDVVHSHNDESKIVASKKKKPVSEFPLIPPGTRAKDILGYAGKVIWQDGPIVWWKQDGRSDPENKYAAQMRAEINEATPAE